MTDITLDIVGAREAAARLMGFNERMPGEMQRTMNRIVIGLAAYIKDAKLSGQVLNRRSGQLSRSMFPRVESSGGNVTGFVGTNVEYAQQKEFGGIIKPIRSNWLTIPLPGALTPSGVMRYPTARDYPNTFLSRNKMEIFERNFNQITPLFKLKREVYQPPRSFMGSALADKRSEIQAQLIAAINGAMQ